MTGVLTAPAPAAAEQIQQAIRERSFTDYIVGLWTAFGWTVCSHSASTRSTSSTSSSDGPEITTAAQRHCSQPRRTWPAAKQRRNYVGRILAVVFTLGLNSRWWVADLMREGNANFQQGYAWEDAIAQSLAGKVMRVIYRGHVPKTV